MNWYGMKNGYMIDYDSRHGLNIKFNAYLNNKSRKIKTNVLL